MKTRAAVAFEAGKPLEICDVELEGIFLAILPMITHIMPVKDINKGFDLMHKGETMRSVVKF